MLLWIQAKIIGREMHICGRASAHGVMGHEIDCSQWTHWTMPYSNQFSITGITLGMVCAILSVGWCISDLFTHTISPYFVLVIDRNMINMAYGNRFGMVSVTPFCILRFALNRPVLVLLLRKRLNVPPLPKMTALNRRKRNKNIWTSIASNWE